MITNRKCPIMTIALGDVEGCWGLECMWCKHTEFGRVCAVSGEKMYVEDGAPEDIGTEIDRVSEEELAEFEAQETKARIPMMDIDGIDPRDGIAGLNIR